MLNVLRKPVIQSPRLIAQNIRNNRNTCGTQLRNPSTIYLRIRIARGNNHAAHSSRNQSIRARPSSPPVRTRLQRHIRRRSASLIASLLERHDFRMIKLVVLMKALADNASIALHQNTANRRIRRRQTHRALCKFESASHPLEISRRRILFWQDFRLQAENRRRQRYRTAAGPRSSRRRRQSAPADSAPAQWRQQCRPSPFHRVW